MTLSPPYRDHAVDLIKGVACLLMVVAHVPFPKAHWIAQATMGSVLFFSSTGMNFFSLADRRPADGPRIAANALFLIFAGFANNYVQGTLWQADVFQSAGMALLAMLALRRLLPSIWTWLFPLPFFIHLLNQHVFYWKISAGGVSSFFLTPGLFPLLPWLSFYLLGAHLKRYDSPRMRLALGGVFLAALALVLARQPFTFNKWWMSPDYWLLGLVFATAALAVSRWWLARHRTIPWPEIRFWGANSLVFYLLHTFVIRLLELRVPSGPWLLIFTLAGTAVLLRAALRLQAAVVRRPPWAVLALAAALAAFVLLLEAFYWHGSFARTFGGFGVTFAFLAAHPAFKRLSARLPRSSPPAQWPSAPEPIRATA